MRKALFLDRDGVVNVDFGYVHRQSDCKFIDGVFEIVRLANTARYDVVIVTNQSGIGRGYFSEEQFLRFSDWMHRKFKSNGANLRKIFYCPHHPEFGVGAYKRDCDCRKPRPGMLHQARHELGLNLEESLIVGDSWSDLEAGARAGVYRRYLYAPGDAQTSEPPAFAYTRIRSLLELGDIF